MALLQANFFSQSLRRTVGIQVILPADKVLDYGAEGCEHKLFKTLYLLHGLIGNNTDWTANTNIQALAEERNLAVVMPSGENSFYVDQAMPFHDYGEYVGRELVAVTRRMFHLSPRREDTFIAGLSMGGFGAIRNGLKYYDTFGYIAGLSSALRIFESPHGEPSKPEDLCFGDWDEAVKTDKNPRVAFEKMAEAGKADPSVSYPKMYMCCGQQDYLIKFSRSLRDFLLENSVDVTWDEGPGEHNWVFWRDQIEKVLNWLPLEERASSISSGNVK